jgi:hypothetical protein
VGSSSMVKSLKAQKLNIPIYCFHYLNKIEEIENHRKKNWAKTDSDYIKESKRFRDIVASAKGARWNLICGVREPIGHCVSFYFQNAMQKFGDYEELTKASTRVEEFIKRFSGMHSDWWWWYSNWFDEQMKAVFGIDVYATEFDKSKGYQIYHGATAELLLIRQEDLRNVWEVAIEEFLGIQNCKLRIANVSKEKDYGGIYQEFLERIELNEDFIKEAYNSKPAKHFYTEQELQRFKQKWDKN